MSLAANIVLARKLSVEDFGLMAFGLAVVAVGGFFSSGGVGAALLRQEREPTREQLEALFGMQLFVATIVATLGLAVGSLLGTAALLAGIMMWSLPLDAFRVPSAIATQRHLIFGPVVRAEVGEMLVYNVVAIVLVLAGAGIWGVAAAVLCRAIAGSALLILGGTIGLLRPRLSYKIIRPLLRFGITLQSVEFVNLGRTQGVNLGAAMFGGVAVLGLWSFAVRLLQPILLLFEAVALVAFPAIARLLRAGEDPKYMLEKGIRLAFGLTGLGVAALAAATPALVPTVFGPSWDDAVPVIPWCLLGMLISGPIVASTTSYLSAIGEAGNVIRAVTLQAVVWFAVAFPLIAPLGAPAIGIGWSVASIVEATYLTRAVRRHVDADVARNALPPIVIAVIAGLLGWLCTQQLGSTLYSAVLGGSVAAALYLILLWPMRPETVREMSSIVRRLAFRR